MTSVAGLGSDRNLLGRESSPYLLQHRDNPVHWRPWGDAAFAEAERRGVPVLLSIGYSACHWCHVMAHESFENEGIARRMNGSFVPVKVDREERPDVDEIYMAFVQATTGAGGWPLTAFLAPDRTPFFGGTYFPPEDRWGRPGFPRVLEGVAAAWGDPARRIQLLSNGQRLLARLRQAAELPGRGAAGGELITDEPIGRGVRQLLAAFDPDHGGFGPAPKFPPSAQATLLLRWGRHRGDAQALRAARFTLRKMADGGMNDQLAGGFHRYSTDREWLVPHFEKMLYDNALLAPVYLLAAQGASGEARSAFAADARRTLEWMAARMRHPEGGFFAALDADSEGEEGRYYVWRLDEIERALGEDAARFAAAYDVTPGGNWEGKTVLRRVLSEGALGRRFGESAEETTAALRRARRALLEARRERTPPGLDDKVLLAWNALAISAFARSFRFGGDEAHLAVAQQAGRFVLDRLRVGGRYRAVWGGGRAKVSAMLDDHAFWLAALLDLHESDFDEAWLAAAEEVADLLDARFAAPSGGYYTTADDHESLPVRTRSAHDGALPSGNAVAADALLRLHALTGASRRREAARGVLAAFWPMARESPTGFPTLLAAGMRYVNEPRQIIVVGDPAREATRDALRALWRRAAGESLILLADARAQDSRLPALRSAAELAGSPRADPVFLPCRGGVCSLPLDDLEAACQDLRS